MTKRVRFYVMVVVTAALALTYSRLTADWSNVAFYAGGAGLIIVIGLVGMPWIEFARDGAFRQPRERSG